MRVDGGHNFGCQFGGDDFIGVQLQNPIAGGGVDGFIFVDMEVELVGNRDDFDPEFLGDGGGAVSGLTVDHHNFGGDILDRLQTTAEVGRFVVGSQNH